MGAIARIPTAVGALAALLVTSYAAPQRTTDPPACAARANGLTLGFAGQFAGVSQDDHKSNVWSGRVSGSMSGGLVVTLEPLGSLMETARSEEHTSELQSRLHLVCRLLLEKKKKKKTTTHTRTTLKSKSRYK